MQLPGPVELQLEIEKAVRRDGQSATARLDGKMKNELREKGSQINKELLLNGLLKTFPKNCISLMTISGAKGSTVSLFFCFVFSFFVLNVYGVVCLELGVLNC